jgi:ankyrin repeat protein
MLMLDSLQSQAAITALNSQDSHGRTCLHYAMYQGHEEVVTEIVQTAGVDLELCDEQVG